MTKEKDASDKAKNVFIITPIGENDSKERIEAQGLIHAVIMPVLKEYNPNIEISDPTDSVSVGSITSEIIKKIVNSDLVIANLTFLNPNVMYELAIRHSANKPVVILVNQSITPKLPFDIKDQRVINYANNFYKLDELKETLKK
ncbi:MAG: hypothetical protein ABF750_08135 [Oenococcus oeni]